MRCKSKGNRLEVGRAQFEQFEARRLLDVAQHGVLHVDGAVQQQVHVDAREELAQHFAAALVQDCANLQGRWNKTETITTAPLVRFWKLEEKKGQRKEEEEGPRRRRDWVRPAARGPAAATGRAASDAGTATRHSGGTCRAPVTAGWCATRCRRCSAGSPPPRPCCG